jgi:hypothetical protein
MKVRCVRILEGGRPGGRIVESGRSSIHVGGEYVVLSLSGHHSLGAEYMLLRDDQPTQTAVWTAAMFEITSPAVFPAWQAIDPYGSGMLITLEPEAWLIDRFWERKEAGESEAFVAFLRGIRDVYEHEHEVVPDEIIELLSQHSGT